MTPASAMTFSSRMTQRSSPGTPGSHSRGVRLVAVANQVLPRPPRPPRQMTTSSPACDQIAQHMAAIAVDDDRSRRHGNDEVVALFAVLVGAGAGPAIHCFPEFAIDNLGQAVGPGHGAEDDIAAIAAVAAIGPAARHFPLPAETAAAFAAVAPFYEYRHTIHEHE